jgi:hypothetical protein
MAEGPWAREGRRGALACTRPRTARTKARRGVTACAGRLERVVARRRVVGADARARRARAGLVGCGQVAGVRSRCCAAAAVGCDAQMHAPGGRVQERTCVWAGRRAQGGQMCRRAGQLAASRWDAALRIGVRTGRAGRADTRRGVERSAPSEQGTRSAGDFQETSARGSRGVSGQDTGSVREWTDARRRRRPRLQHRRVRLRADRHRTQARAPGRPRTHGGNQEHKR